MMTEAKHTPWPWWNNHGWSIHAADQSHIASLASRPEREANAQLFTAAPALLAACRDKLPNAPLDSDFPTDLERFADGLDFTIFAPFSADLRAKAAAIRAAIAAAEGGE